MYLSTPHYAAIARRIAITNLTLPLIWSHAFFDTWARAYRAAPYAPKENIHG